MKNTIPGTTKCDYCTKAIHAEEQQRIKYRGAVLFVCKTCKRVLEGK